MTFREVSVIEVKEVLRRWLRNDGGVRSIASGAGVDRKTARRYIEAAVGLGLDRGGGEGQLTDALIGGVCEKVRPSRPHGHGTSWELLCTQEEDIKAWLEKGLTVAKIGDLLARRCVVVPEATSQRFCVERCGAGAQRTTVRVADGEPGKELQTDFGRMGVMFDPHTDRRRVVHALIVVAVWSRHMFVWLTFGQTTGDVIAGLDAAWSFFAGVFGVLIPYDLSPVVSKADPTEPRPNDTFVEYTQARGFLQLEDRDVVGLGERVHLLAEAVANLVEQRRRRDRVAEVSGQEALHLATDLAVRDVGTQVDAVDALHFERDVPVQHVVDVDDSRGHAHAVAHEGRLCRPEALKPTGGGDGGGREGA